MINTLHSDHYQITTEISRLGPNGGVPYNEQLAIARRWDRAIDAGSPITAQRRSEWPVHSTTLFKPNLYRSKK